MHRSKTVSLFDDFVGKGEQRRGHSEAKRLRGLEVDRQFELGQPLDWQIAWLGAPEDTTDVALLRDLVPRAATIGFLMNPSFTHAESQLRDMQEAVRALALQIHVLRASTDSEIDSAFESIAQQRIPALAVGSDPFFVTRREQLIAQAAR